MGDVFDEVQPDKPTGLFLFNKKTVATSAPAPKGDIFDQVAAKQDAASGQRRIIPALPPEYAAAKERMIKNSQPFFSDERSPVLNKIVEFAANSPNLLEASPDMGYIPQAASVISKIGTGILGLPAQAVSAVIDAATNDEAVNNAAASVDSLRSGHPLDFLGHALAPTPLGLVAKAADKIIMEPQRELGRKADALDVMAANHPENAEALTAGANTNRRLSIFPFMGPVIANAADKIQQSTEQGSAPGIAGAVGDVVANAVLLGLGAQSERAGAAKGESVLDSRPEAPPVIEKPRVEAVGAPPEVVAKPDVFDIAADRAASVARQEAKQAAIIENARKLVNPETANAELKGVDTASESPTALAQDTQGGHPFLSQEENAALESSGLTVDRHGRLARVVNPESGQTSSVVPDAAVTPDRPLALKQFMDANLEYATRTGEAFDRSAIQKRAEALPTNELVGAANALRENGIKTEPVQMVGEKQPESVRSNGDSVTTGQTKAAEPVKSATAPTDAFGEMPSDLTPLQKQNREVSNYVVTEKLTEARSKVETLKRRLGNAPEQYRDEVQRDLGDAIGDLALTEEEAKRAKSDPYGGGHYIPKYEGKLIKLEANPFIDAAGKEKARGYYKDEQIDSLKRDVKELSANVADHKYKFRAEAQKALTERQAELSSLLNGGGQGFKTNLLSDGEAGFIKADALLPKLPGFKSEPPPVSENLRAIRLAQVKKVVSKGPELPPVEKIIQAVPEYAKKVSRTMYDRFRDWRQVTRDLKSRGIELSAAENPDFVLDIVYGGTGGKLQAEAVLMKRVVDEAAKLGIKGDVGDYLNLSGYKRAFNTLESRRAEATARFERENFNANRGSMVAKGKASEAARDVAAIEGKIRAGQVVPRYLKLDDVEADIQNLREIRGERKFRQIGELADKVFDLNARAWKAAHEAGIISTENYEKGVARGKQYIPLERIMDEVAPGGGGAFGAAVNLDLKNQKILKKFEGSNRYNKEPFSASLDRIFETYREVEKNRAAKVAVESLLKDKGEDGYARDVVLVERKKIDYFQGKREGEAVVPKLPADKGSISFYQNGEKLTYAVPRVLADALNVANSQLAGSAITSVMGKTRNIFRAGATGKNLAFILKNVPRDVIDLHLLSEASGGISPIEHAKFVYRWAESFYDALKENDRYLDFLRSGAANSTLQKAITPDTFLKLNTKADTHGFVGTVLDTPAKVLDVFAKLNSAAEEATKISGLKTLKERGFGDTEAAIETRRFAGSPDFARRGSGSKDLDLAFMFANVGIQGTSRLLQRVGGLGKNPGMWAGAVGATLSLYLNNSQYTDSKGVRDIDRVPESTRRNNWVILRPETYRTDDGQVRHLAWLVPKPQGVRVAFNALDDAANAAVTGKHDATQSALNIVSDLLPGQFNLRKDKLGKSTALGVLSSANPLLKVPVEAVGNIDSFTGTPIVPKRMEKLPSVEQKTLFTSPTAVKIGEAINQSPLQIEHAIRSVFGGLGEQGLALADLPQQKGRKLGRLEGDQLTANRPLVGIFARGFVGSAGDQVERDAAEKFYDLYGKSSEALERFNVLKKRDINEARQFLEDPQNKVFAMTHSGLQKTVEVLGKIRRAEESVERGNDSPEDARKKMAFLREKRMEAYAQAARVEKLMELQQQKQKPVRGIFGFGARAN